MNNSIIISRNTRLTFKLIAKAIYVSADGDVTIVTKQYSPNTSVPPMDINYLEALCSKFYYGGYHHKNAIADILLLNGFLLTSEYEYFYEHLSKNLEEQKITIICSELLL